MNTYIETMKKKIIGLGVGLLCSAIVLAQETATAPVPIETKTNPLWWLILTMMTILLIAIIALSNILLNLARITVEKGKAAKAVSIIVLLLVCSIAFAQDAAAPVKATSSAFSDWNLIFASMVLIAEFFVVLVLVSRIGSMLNELSPKPVKQKVWNFHFPKFFDVINAAVPVEREADVMLDHNYDGIRELDNALPPWWKYGFYATIIFAVCYMWYYSFGGGPTSHDEYVTEMAQAKVDVDDYMKKNALNVDENTVKMGDATMIAEGKKIFSENCTPCHGQNGEGNAVGPNLTDDYWLHGGSVHDVFKTIKYGWPAKGMRSWKDVFSPVQIQDLASFVKSIQGSNPPNAKAPQGDLYQEGGAVSGQPAAAKSDSTNTAAK